MKRLLLLVVVVLFCVGRLVGAQTVTATTGAINGRVADATGGVLPGVTVMIASPSLMGTRTATTDEEGFFRFPAVPPGEYKVTFELAGFTTLDREGIKVGLGFTATVNVEMGITSLQETVTVSGASPVVDTQATTLASNFSADTLKNLPFSAEYWGMLSVAPAVNMSRMDSGGSEAMNPLGHTVYGLSGQGRGVVEGMVVTWSNSQVMFYTEPFSFSEIQLNTLGAGAEAPTPGVTAQLFSKSGGNTFHGSFYSDYEDGSWSTRNIDAAQLALGVTGGSGVAAVDTNRLVLYRKVAGDIGGYAIKDRLWWYYAVSHLRVDRRLVNLIGGPQISKNPTNSAKVTFKATPTINLIGYYQGTRKQQDPYLSGRARVGGSAIYEPKSAWLMQWRAGLWKGEWNQSFSNNLFAEIRGGNWWSDWNNLTMSDSFRYEDIGTNVVNGGAHGWREIRDRPQVLGSVNYFKSGWGGSHDLKVGAEVAREGLKEDERGFKGNIAMLYRNGVPAEVMIFDAPNENESGLWNQAAYISDTWRINARLTITPGLRYDRYRSFLAAQEHQPGFRNPTAITFPAVSLITWNHLVPRIGAVYDVSGNGKNVVKFQYGTYAYNPSNTLSAALNPNQSHWSYRYTWTDRNGDSLYQPGEEGVFLENVGGVASIRVDPNLENTYAREASVMMERELLPNFGVRTGFVWVGVRNQRTNINQNRPASAFTVPVTIQDPGADARVGTADDGGAVTGWNLAPQYVGLPTQNIMQNVPGTNNYYTWEISGDKRMSNRWSLQTSFAQTWHQESNLDAFWNPNLQINRVDGQDRFTRWQAKLAGTFELGYGIRVSPLLRHQSGSPYGRTFVAVLNSGSTTILAEPLDSNRTRNATLVDVRAEKGFRFAGDRRIAAFLDLYNIFNSNVENSISAASGTTWLRPLSIISPRVVKLGVKVDW